MEKGGVERAPGGIHDAPRGAAQRMQRMGILRIAEEEKMSGTANPRSGMTRRGFLKVTGIAAGAAGLAGAASMTTAGSWLAPAEAHAAGEETSGFLCHMQHCTCACSVKATARDGRLVKVEPHKTDDYRYGKICLKGISEIQHIYSADRLQTPMKRVGERGSGEFEAISWDEALDILAAEVGRIQDTYGKDALLITNSEESKARYTPFLPRILGAQNGGLTGRDRGQGNGVDPAFSTKGLNANSPMTIWEWPKSKTIILMSYNMLESAVTYAQAFFNAQEAGAKIYVIDPQYSVTAAKADEWVPIVAGTDPALMLAMIHYIIDAGLYDEEFIMAHTSLPFLVDADSGAQLKDAAGDPLVWDVARNAAVPYTAIGADTALEGAYEVDGRRAVTQFELLRSKTDGYTREWAEGITDVPAETIIRLAEDYAEGPSILSGSFGGIDKFSNSDIAGHTYAVLAALTGNSGYEGTGTGKCNGGSSTRNIQLTPWKLPAEYKAVTPPVAFYELPYKENKVKGALFFGDMPTQSAAAADNTKEWVKSLEFTALIDIFHTSIADYVDLILPVCTKFEGTEPVNGIRSSHDHVYLIEKIIDPQFDSKTDFQIECAIAERMGYGDLIPKSFEEYVRNALDSDAARKGGITLEALIENEGYMPVPKANVLQSRFRSQEYETPTKRIEVYYENLVDDDQALPTWVRADEAYEDNPKREEYPFFFNQVRSRFRIHSNFSGAGWIQDLFQPHISMNPVDAERLGLATGDDVDVYNDRGSFGCALVVDNSVRPGSITMVESTYGQHLNHGIMQNVTNTNLVERQRGMLFGPQVLFNDTLVAVRKA